MVSQDIGHWANQIFEHWANQIFEHWANQIFDHWSNQIFLPWLLNIIDRMNDLNVNLKIDMFHLLRLPGSD